MNDHKPNNLPFVNLHGQYKTNQPSISENNNFRTSNTSATYTYMLDVLWGQPIKLIQVASTSELRENQRNDLLFFEIVPCHFCWVSEVQT